MGCREEQLRPSTRQFEISFLLRFNSFVMAG